jgi:phospholipid N-methyltransferase
MNLQQHFFPTTLAFDNLIDGHQKNLRVFPGAAFDTIICVVPFAVTETRDPLRRVKERLAMPQPGKLGLQVLGAYFYWKYGHR